jgi:uncharacterized protein YvpB
MAVNENGAAVSPETLATVYQFARSHTKKDRRLLKVLVNVSLFGVPQACEVVVLNDSL